MPHEIKIVISHNLIQGALANAASVRTRLYTNGRILLATPYYCGLVLLHTKEVLYWCSVESTYGNFYVT